MSEQAVNHDDVKQYRRDPEMFIRLLDTPEWIVLAYTPEMSIPFDGDKMAQAIAQAYANFAAEDASGGTHEVLRSIHTAISSDAGMC